MVASIDFLHELCERLDQATQANLNTSTRKGSLVQLGLDDAQDVLVSGDLHGNRKNFNAILRYADLEKHPRRHLILQEVVHGGPTHPNGGCMSHMLLEDVAKWKVQFPDRIHFLLSNHELSEATNVQMMKGGVSQNQHLAQGIQHAYGPAASRITEGYHKFILSCPLAVRLKNGVFISHSIPDAREMQRFDVKVFTRSLTDKDIRSGGSANALVWGRDYTDTNASAFAKLVRSNVLISGHQPQAHGFDMPNRCQLILDNVGPQCWCCVIPLGKPIELTDLKKCMINLAQPNS